MRTPPPNNLVALGEVVGAHGVKGEVKIRPLGENPAALVGPVPLLDAAGARLGLRGAKVAGGMVIATIGDCRDRDAAAALKGMRLYGTRADLGTADAGEYFHADLIGLEAVDETGKNWGRVSAVLNFGAGDLIEVTDTDGKKRLLPFIDAAVPGIEAEKLILDPDFLA